MSVVTRLASGADGIELKIPSTFEPREDRDGMAVLVDPANEVVWHLFLANDVVLDLSDTSAASLERDVRTHTEYLREVMESSAADFDGKLSPRHPLVSYEHVTVDGKPALSILHRMSLKPGNELVMGHLLVPIRDGLFEARWITKDALTGLRESILFAEELAKHPGADEFVLAELSKSIDYDNPRYDAQFPKHALSRSRAAARWITTDAGIRVTAPPRAIPPRDVELAPQGCSLTLPPRYVAGEPQGNIAKFSRATLAVNDGIETLDILRFTAPETLELVCKGVIARNGCKLTRTVARTPPDPIRAMIVCDGAMGPQTIRVVTAMWGPQPPFVAILVTTPSRSEDLLEEELVSLAKSCRPLAGGRIRTVGEATKPWWKFW